MKKGSFEVPLKAKEEIADGTLAFFFEKPEGFRFKAGQHVRMTLIDPAETDGGNSRFFSLASTPQDVDLVIAMRMRDTAFKRVMGCLQIGAKVRIDILLDVPHGAFALHEDTARPAVFLAGGIGIAPALSMIKDAVERGLPYKMFLFYSNRRPEDAAYLDELRKLAEQSPSFKLIATMTEAGNSAGQWKGETGHIDRAMLARQAGDLPSAIYYVSGLPEMVSAMKSVLVDSGAGEDSIHAEEFTGFNLNEIVAAQGWKRHVAAAAIVLAVVLVLGAHAGVAVSISRNGLGEFLNPLSYAAIGLLIFLGMIKVSFLASLHRTGRSFFGHLFGNRGHH
ncbi:FAD-dependent oxidoreductase [Mesorhizobium sp. M7A.F.Ca.US.008.03.1.1]|nr:FAD-dependent oxidoreductase [Mesorhizobium sp. M7A.F.Ca.US.008.03.1.1]